MGVFRRRRDRQDRSARTAGLDPAAVAERILAAAEQATGAPARLVEGPEAVPAGAGPDAWTFGLDTDDERWSGQLVARTSPVEVLARESRWIAAVGARGEPVPDLLHDRPDEGILVFRPPGGENLVTLMTTELMALPELLATFGRMHARLHALPVDGLGADGDGAGHAGDGRAADPVDELVARAATLGVRKAVDRELGWLRSRRDARTDGAAVICHGDLHPVHVFVWRGDEPRQMAVNWTKARLAAPAFDVAGTLASFWTGPLFVANVAQRTMLKMARDSLASSYQAAYEEAAGPLDPAALAYWQAFHLGHLAVHLVDVLRGDAIDPWHPAAAVPQPDKALQDVRNRFWELADA
ncbi:MAG TPA: phosphotransferase [Acidimicrobiales bacterium]